MFEKHCPRCRSTRLQLGYKESSLRLIGIGELLCNNCNLEFKSFTLFGSLRREQSTREETTRNRRRAPRFKVRLPVRVAQIISYSDGGEARLSTPLSGEARDLSKLGLAIILPASGVGGYDFTDLSKRLSIHLTLPDGVVTMG